MFPNFQSPTLHTSTVMAPNGFKSIPIPSVINIILLVKMVKPPRLPVKPPFHACSLNPILSLKPPFLLVRPPSLPGQNQGFAPFLLLQLPYLRQRRLPRFRFVVWAQHKERRELRSTQVFPGLGAKSLDGNDTKTTFFGMQLPFSNTKRYPKFSSVPLFSHGSYCWWFQPIYNKHVRQAGSSIGRVKSKSVEITNLLKNKNHS